MREFYKAFSYGFGATIGVAVGIYAVIIWHIILFIFHDLTH